MTQATFKNGTGLLSTLNTIRDIYGNELSFGAQNQTIIDVQNWENLSAVDKIAISNAARQDGFDQVD